LDDYARAREKLPDAEFTSNVDIADECPEMSRPRRKRR